MGFDWKQALHIGAKIVGTVVPGVAAVEQIATEIVTLRGPAKQDAVVLLVRNALLAAEGITAKDLANDADVELATRRVIDAVVALQNVIAHKAPSPAGV